MKLAVLLRGISYCPNTNGYSNTAKVDYRECIESFRTNVLSQLRGLFDSIDFFLVTYYCDREVFTGLLEEFKPVDVSIMPTSELYKKRDNSYVAHLIATGLKLVSEYESNYTHVLQTRFDLFYYRKLNLDKVDLSKVNIAWTALDAGQCDDAFILSPIEYNRPMIAYYGPGGYTHRLNSVPEIRNNCSYISKPLDPANGYHFPDFFIYQRNLPEYRQGLIKLY